MVGVERSAGGRQPERGVVGRTRPESVVAGQNSEQSTLGHQPNYGVLVRLLGPLGVEVDGREIRIGSASQRRILSLLALSPGRAISTSALVDAVWAEDPPETALMSLRNQVSRLRSLLGRDFIEATPPGYALRVDPSLVDRHAFDAVVSDGAASIEQIDEALSGWRGPPLLEFAAEMWARPEAVRLAEAHLVLQERRIALLLEQGLCDDAVVSAEALSIAEPVREHTHALLMTALARTGRAGEALQVFTAFRRRVVDEFGVEPSASLRSLERSILDGTIDASPPAPSPARASLAPAPFPNALVVANSALPMVGREVELTAIGYAIKASLDGGAQTVIVKGEPGIGKTRLVAEAARRAANDGAQCFTAAAMKSWFPVCGRSRRSCVSWSERVLLAG